MIVSILRKEARENLKGKWKKAILIMLVYYIITILISWLRSYLVANTEYGLLINIFNIIITISINYGLLATFIRLKRNEKTNCFHCIYYAGRDVEKFWKVIGRFFLRLLLPIIALILSAYLVITEVISLYYGYGIRLSFFVEIICFIAVTVYLCMQMLYYSLNNYVLFDNNKLKAKEILNESKRLMKNHRWDFMKLNISFIGWYLLGTIFNVGIILFMYYVVNINNIALVYVSFIPLMFILPYVNVSTVCFYDNILYNNPKINDEQKNKQHKKTKKKNKEKNKNK